MAKTAAVASFPRPAFLQQMVQKKRKETTRHRHQRSSQRPPQGMPLIQNCEAGLERVSDPLGAKGHILPVSVGSAPTWSERVSTIFEKVQNLTESCRLLERAPSASQVRRWPFDIVLLITTAGVLLPIPSPPAATGDSSLGSEPVALGASDTSCQQKLHLV